MAAHAQIRRAADRAVTTTPWLTSRHCFSFGDHYDPGNTHHGLLLVSNDDVVLPATGFEMHPHRDMEIVTWVLHGELSHRDSTGTRGVIYPGLAQRMSAGRGILHSEKNESPTEDVHFVQMWVAPDESGIDPSYQQHEVDPASLAGGLVPIASGRLAHDAAITLHNGNAALLGARPPVGATVQLPAAPYLHLYVARGSVSVEGLGALDQGDAVRFTDDDGRSVTATQPAELLVWEMHARLGE